MKRIKQCILATFGLAILAGSFVLGNPMAGHSYATPPADDVKVINAVAEPVPTTVTNSPTVMAAQSGRWSVGISGTPTVKIGNAAENPVLMRDVDNPASQPFHESISFDLPEGFTEVNMPITTVPVGKRLVIEYISAKATLPAGQKLRNLAIRTSLNGNLVYHYLVQTPTGIFNEYVTGQQVRLYADPNTLPHLSATRNTGDGTTAVRVSISGYLVDIP